MTAPTTDLLPAEGPVTLAEAAELPLVDFSPGWAVRHGLGVCVMPPSSAARFHGLTVRPFAGHAPTWTMRVVHPRGDSHPAVTALLSHIRPR